MTPTVLHYLMFHPQDDSEPNWKYRQRLDPIWGMQSLLMFGHNVLFPPDDPDGTGPVDKEHLQRRLEGIDQTEFPYLMLNVEGGSYGLQNGQVVPEIVAKRVDLVECVKAIRPDIKVGLFREPPVSMFNRATGGLLKHAEWVVDCNRMKSVADVVDYVMPSIYPLRSWGGARQAIKYAQRIIEVCRELYIGKPIIPIVKAEFFDAWKLWRADMRSRELWQTGKWKHTPDPDEWRNLKARLIPRRYWRRLAGTVLKEAGNMAIWGGQGSPNWYEKFPWWKEQKKLLVKYGVVPTTSEETDES